MTSSVASISHYFDFIWLRLEDESEFDFWKRIRDRLTEQGFEIDGIKEPRPVLQAVTGLRVGLLERHAPGGRIPEAVSLWLRVSGE